MLRQRCEPESGHMVAQGGESPCWLLTEEVLNGWIMLNSGAKL